MKTPQQIRNEVEKDFCCDECGRDLVWDNHRESCSQNRNPANRCYEEGFDDLL